MQSDERNTSATWSSSSKTILFHKSFATIMNWHLFSLCRLLSNYINNNIGKINKPILDLQRLVILRPGESPSKVQCTLAAVLLRTAEVVLVEGVGVCGGACVAADGALPLTLEHARLQDNRHPVVSVSGVNSISLLIKKWDFPQRCLCKSLWIKVLLNK